MTHAMKLDEMVVAWASNAVEVATPDVTEEARLAKGMTELRLPKHEDPLS